MQEFTEVRSFEQWRQLARPLLSAGLTAAEVRVPALAMRLLQTVANFRDDGRWELMYRLAWRLLHENSRLLEDEADADVRRAQRMASAVRRECHKMHAFVRFRERLAADGSVGYFAWFEPEHEILRRASPFFVKRFPNMNWTIATPDGAATWDGRSITFIDGPQAQAAGADSVEDLWRTYYRSICNVARINPQMMQKEMPRRYWRNLPESREIGGLIRDGGELFARRHRETEAPLIPKGIEAALRRLPGDGGDLQACRRCGLWERATQAVDGEGPESAQLMLVGEQPGDLEDLSGRPFVGPAGELLDGVLLEAGLMRSDVFVTNAVRHFGWEPRGKRRMHRRPQATEVVACSGWLQQEIDRIQPRVIVALGATALRSLTGSQQSVERARAQPLRHPSGALIVASYHPAALLRATAAQARRLRDSLLADLGRARLAVATAAATEGDIRRTAGSGADQPVS